MHLHDGARETLLAGDRLAIASMLCIIPRNLLRPILTPFRGSSSSSPASAWSPFTLIIPLLPQRQFELIACISMVTDVGRASSNSAAAEALIDSVRRKIAGPWAMMGAEPEDKIELLDLMGKGSVSHV